MELVVIKGEEYGLEEQKAKQISALFTPMLKTMEELEVELNEVLKLPMNEETYTKARELRIRYKKTRTGTAEIHKKAKAHSLAIGKFLDGWKRTQAFAADVAEERLYDIEKHEELEKQRKIDVLLEKRAKALKKYDLEVVPDNLGELDTVSWNNYLTGTKVNFTKRKEKEKKEEEDHLENERIMELGNVRTAETVKYADFIPEYKTLKLGWIEEKEYHDILQKAKDKFDAKVKQDELDRQELDRLRLAGEKRKKEEKKQKERMEKMIELGLVWDGEQFTYKDINFHWVDLIAMPDKEFNKAVKGATERMTVLRKEESDLAAKDKREKEEGDKARQELADQKVEEDRKLQEELDADDATKVESLVKNLVHLAQHYTFKSVKNQKMYTDVGVLLAKVINHIEK